MRTGATHNPHYRIVVIDSRSRRSGHYIEQVGHYHPQTEGSGRLEINNERAEYWIKVGAQPTDRVAKLLKEVDVALPPKLLAQRRAGLQRREVASE